MQLILRLFFNRNDIIVKQVVTQRSAQNLYGRGVRFDVLAVDSKGKLYNCEVQRADEGAIAKRADYFKAETKGVNTMYEIMEQLQAEGRAEGRSQMAIDIAIDMLRDNKPLDEIAKYSRLPLERIQELASTLPKE